MALPTLSHAAVLQHVSDADSPNSPNEFTLSEIAAAISVTSATVSTVTSMVVSTAASGALDSVPVSTAASKAESASTRASVADSKALSASANVSIADSKAISDSANISVAESHIASVAAYTAAPSTLVSIADSKAVSVATTHPGDTRTVATLSAYLNNNLVYNVKDYGAVGDGVTNDATSIRAAFTACQGTDNGKILFPPGTYYIGEYRNTAGVDPGSIDLTDCDGVVISGYGATISLDGTYDRSASTITSVSFKFTGCTNMRIEGLVIDGNADLTTNSSGSTENISGTPLRFNGCTDVDLVDLWIHHTTEDGILYDVDSRAAQPWPPCYRFRTIRCRVEHNARGGFAPLHVRDSVWEQCEFNYIGVTGGAYGFHAPQFGVDIEPNGTVASGYTTANTGNLVFRDCRSVGCVGATFTGTNYTRYSGFIHVLGGFYQRGVAGNVGFFFRLSAPDALCQNVTFDSLDDYVQFSFTGDSTVRIRYSGCQFTGYGQMALGNQDVRVSFEDCAFVGTHTGALAAASPALGLMTTYGRVRRCRFFLPAAATGGGTIATAISIGANISESNRFETDASSGLLKVAYNAATKVHDDLYVNPIYLVPSTLTSAAAILTYPFSKNANSIGGVVVLGSASATWNPPNLASLAQQTFGTTLTVTGAVAGDKVVVDHTSALNGTFMYGHVTAADTVTIYHFNPTGVAVDVVSGTVSAIVYKTS